MSISLLWNLYNLLETRRVAKQIRQENFDLDEWKSHRTTLASRLDDFENCADRLLALTQGEHKSGELLSEISKEARLLVSAHEALLRSLERCGGVNWMILGYGNTVSGESDWDRLNTSLASVAQMDGDPHHIREVLSSIKPNIRSIAGAVTGRIADQSAAHRPE